MEENLRDPDVKGRLLLTLIRNIWDVKNWIGLINTTRQSITQHFICIQKLYILSGRLVSAL